MQSSLREVKIICQIHLTSEPSALRAFRITASARESNKRHCINSGFEPGSSGWQTGNLQLRPLTLQKFLYNIILVMNFVKLQAINRNSLRPLRYGSEKLSVSQNNYIQWFIYLTFSRTKTKTICAKSWLSR